MKREAEQDVEKLENQVKEEEGNIKGQESDEEKKPGEEGQNLSASGKQYHPKSRIAIIVGYNGSDFCGS
jgi:hypothetical protein